MFSHFLEESITDILTVVQTLNFDLVEVQRGGHTDVKGTLRDGVSSVTHSDGHVALMETQTTVNSGLSLSSYVINQSVVSPAARLCSGRCTSSRGYR